jgi:hypothetical protein
LEFTELITIINVVRSKNYDIAVAGVGLPKLEKADKISVICEEIVIVEAH